jgi:hypothetical protein
MELPVPPSAPTVCRRLRSKGTPGVTYEGSVSWQSGFVSTASFWCTATGDAVGPDDTYVHPHVCVAGRVCFCESLNPVDDHVERPPV